MGMRVLRRGFASDESMAQLLLDRGTLTVPAAHDNFPGSKLFNNNLDDNWLTYSQRSSHTWMSLTSDISSENRTLGAVSLLRVNRKTLIPPNAGFTYTQNLYRVMIDRNPLVDRIRPAIVGFSKTNLTGAQSDVEGPVHPPSEPVSPSYVATRLTATSPSSNTILTVTYDNKHGAASPYTTTERLLTGTQFFYVHVRDSADPETWPTIAVVLRQSGVDIGSIPLFEDAEKTSEGFLFTYAFDAATLTSTTGAVGFRITGTTTGISAPEIIGVSWVTNLADLDYDSDWLVFDGTANVVAVPDLVIPFDTPINVQIEWSDYSSVSQTTVSGHLVNIFTDLGGLFYAGRFAGGDTLDVPLPFDGSYTLRKAGNTGSMTRAYQADIRFPRNASTWWEADVTVLAQKQARIFGELEDLFNAMGLYSLPTLFIPDPNDLNTAIWACLSAWEAPHRGTFSGIDDDDLPYNSVEMYELEFSIVEKTGRRTTR